MQNRCFLAAFYAPAPGSNTNPHVAGPLLLRFPLHGSWLSRAVVGRCDGSRGTAALCEVLSTSRKSWLENAAEQTRAPRSAARGKEITISINPRRETASPTLARDKKRSFLSAAEDVVTAIAQVHRVPRAGPRSSRTTRWKSLESNPPQRAASGRAAARRPGRAPGVERNLRLETPRFRAQAFTQYPKTTCPQQFRIETPRFRARAFTRNPKTFRSGRRPRTTTSRPPSRRTSRQDPRRDDSSSRPTTRCRPTGARKVVDTCEGGSSVRW